MISISRSGYGRRRVIGEQISAHLEPGSVLGGVARPPGPSIRGGENAHPYGLLAPHIILFLSLSSHSFFFFTLSNVTLIWFLMLLLSL